MKTRNSNTSSRISMMALPSEVWKRALISASNACGRRATIPIMIISEIPLPIPLSVIFSPSHMMNMVPAIRMTVAYARKRNVFP